jgi:hypothetical protein
MPQRNPRWQVPWPGLTGKEKSPGVGGAGRDNLTCSCTQGARSGALVSEEPLILRERGVGGLDGGGEGWGTEGGAEGNSEDGTDGLVVRVAHVVDGGVRGKLGCGGGKSSAGMGSGGVKESEIGFLAPSPPPHPHVRFTPQIYAPPSPPMAPGSDAPLPLPAFPKRHAFRFGPTPALG